MSDLFADMTAPPERPPQPPRPATRGTVAADKLGGPVPASTQVGINPRAPQASAQAAAGADLFADMTAAPAPSAQSASEPPPYRNKVEALDDAVNYLSQGRDISEVAAGFQGIGITQEEIIAHQRLKTPPRDVPFVEGAARIAASAAIPVVRTVDMAAAGIAEGVKRAAAIVDQIAPLFGAQPNMQQRVAESQDKLFRESEERAARMRQEYNPQQGEEFGVGAQVVGGVASLPLEAVGGMGIQRGIERSADVVQRGGSLGEAGIAGGVTGAANVAANLLPIKAGGAAGRAIEGGLGKVLPGGARAGAITGGALTGGALGVAGDEAVTRASNASLPEGQQFADLKQESDPAISFGLGAAFGALPGVAAPRRTVAQPAEGEPAKTAGTQGSVGAAGTDKANQRRTTAANLPVPVPLSEGQATREAKQQQFEKQQFQDADTGAALRELTTEQTDRILKNFDALEEQSGGQEVGTEAVGEAVVNPIMEKAAAAKAEIRAAYDAADAAGETAEMVPYTRLTDYLEQQTPTEKEKLAPILKMVEEQIAKNDPDGTGEMSIKAMEDIRKAIKANTEYGTPNSVKGGELTALIDASTKDAGGNLYQGARKLYAKYAAEFKNQGVIADLINLKKGTTDRKVAFEDVFKKTVLNGPVENLRRLQATLEGAGDKGAQAMRELRAAAVRHIREQATRTTSRDERGNPVPSVAGLTNVVKALDKDGKLETLFGKEGAQTFRDMAEVASDIYTAPPGLVNTSGTAAAMSKLLADMSAGWMTSGIPIPFLTAAKALKNWRSGAKNKKLVAKAVAQKDSTLLLRKPDLTARPFERSAAPAATPAAPTPAKAPSAPAKAAPVPAGKATELDDRQGRRLLPSKRERELFRLMDEATDPEIKKDLQRQIDADRKGRDAQARGEEYLQLADSTTDPKVRADFEAKAKKLGVERKVPAGDATEVETIEATSLAEVEANWQKTEKLNAENAQRGKDVLEAFLIDPRATTAATTQFASQPTAYDRAIRKIIEWGKNREASVETIVQGSDAPEGSEGSIRQEDGQQGDREGEPKFSERAQEGPAKVDEQAKQVTGDENARPPQESASRDGSQQRDRQGSAQQRAAGVSPLPVEGSPEGVGAGAGVRAPAVPAEVLQDLAKIDQLRVKRDPGNPTRLVVVPSEDVHAGVAEAVANEFSLPVYFLRNELGDMPFNGVTWHDRIYIAADSTQPAVSVAIHEVTHNLSPDIRKRMVDTIMETVSAQQEADFFRLLPGYKMLPRDKQREEIACRIIEQDSQNPGFWLALHRKLGATEFGKLVRSVLQSLDKIINGFSKYDSSQFTTDIKKVREAVADAYAATLALDESKKVLLKPLASERQATRVFKDDRTAGPRKAGDETVSTRVPSSVNPGENAITDHLLVGMGVVSSNPGLLKKHADLIRNDAAHKPRGRLSDEKVINTFIESMKQNLLYLFDSMPERNRLRSMNWYKGANRIAGRLADAADISKRAASGVLASLSPQTPWDVNVSQAGRVISIWKNQQRTKADPVMNVWFQGKIDALEEAGKSSEVLSRIADYLRGKSLKDIDDLNLQAWWIRAYDETHHDRSYWLVAPEGEPAELMRNKPKRPGEPGTPSNMPWGNAGNIAKAISILKDDSIGNISAQLGAEHKVRSFYNNIVEPDSKNGHVTIDTHAVAAARLQPLSGNSPEVGQAWGGQGSSSVFGQGGLYGEYAEAYRRAAAERGVLPREMQSVTWEAVRGLFGASFKTEGAANDIKRIWIQHQRGAIDTAAARQRVVERAGGLAGPNWSGAGDADAQETGPAGNGREPLGGTGAGQVEQVSYTPLLKRIAASTETTP